MAASSGEETGLKPPDKPHRTKWRLTLETEETSEPCNPRGNDGDAR